MNSHFWTVVCGFSFQSLSYHLGEIYLCFYFKGYIDKKDTRLQATDLEKIIISKYFQEEIFATVAIHNNVQNLVLIMNCSVCYGLEITNFSTNLLVSRLYESSAYSTD